MIVVPEFRKSGRGADFGVAGAAGGVDRLMARRDLVFSIRVMEPEGECC